MMPEDLPQDRPLDPAWLTLAIAAALDEDLGGDPGRDVTTQSTIPAGAQVTGDIVVRDTGVLAGLHIVGHTLGQVATRLGLPKPRVTVLASDGDVIAAGTTVAQISGAGHVVLVAERTILNFLSKACGIATHTRQWVDALEGLPVRVLDTRKTTPGLRELEKYAVRCGGGTNKRMGLFDCAMIKDNHIVAAGSVAGAIAAVNAKYPGVPVQVEVERESQALEAIDAGARFLMLDNMTTDAMRALVTVVRELEDSVGRVRLEATGGLTLANAREVANTGVDFMSVGALTHSSPILDIALDLH